MGVRVAASAGVERQEQVRLVDEVHTHLEVVPQAAHAGHVPREVVAELILLLLGRLWRVDVLPDRHGVREHLIWIQAVRRDGVGEIRVLEDELVQPRAAEHVVVVQIERVELVRAEAPAALRRGRADAVRLRILIVAVSHGQELRRADVRRLLHGDEAFGIGGWVDTVLGGEQPVGRHGLERILLRPLDRREEMRLVPGDRPAEAAAVLVAAVLLLIDVGDLFGFRLRVHLRVPEQLEEAALRPVRAALGHDVHYAAVAAPVLGLVARRDQVELLNGLERKELQQAADRVVVVVAAVDLIIQVAAVSACDLW